MLQITKPGRWGDPAKMGAAGRSPVLCPRRRVFLPRKVSGLRVGVRGTTGSAWAKEVAAEVLLAARLSHSSRGRCRCRHCPPVSRPARARGTRPRERALTRSRVSTALLRPAPQTHTAATQAARARVSSSAAWRLSMRRSEGEAKCGHRACAELGPARLRGSLGMLGEDRSPAHA